MHFLKFQLENEHSNGKNIYMQVKKKNEYSTKKKVQMTYKSMKSS